MPPGKAAPGQLTSRSAFSGAGSRSCMGPVRPGLRSPVMRRRRARSPLSPTRRGWAPADPGLMLGTPRTGKHLPQVLAREQVAAVLDGPGRGARLGTPDSAHAGAAAGSGRAAAAPDGPAVAAAAAADSPRTAALAARDMAIMELLYASAIRVSELCGLDLGDLDEHRRTIRVLGKRSKERVVPVGIPALRAVRAWIQEGRPVVLSAAAGRQQPGQRARAAVFLGRPGRPDRPAYRPAGGPSSGSRPPGRSRTPARTGCATPRPPTCWRAARTCAACRRCSATRPSPPPRSTPT